FDPIGEEVTLRTILRTVQTATSLSGILDIVAHARHFEELVIHWWFLLSEALSALPGDFVFKLQVVGADRYELANEKGEDVIREIFRKLSKRRRVLFRIEDAPDWCLGLSGWYLFEMADKGSWNSVEVKEERNTCTVTATHP
ncbi:hypothetical protein MPER_09314, partial [Moniliophthora perniciosa FA553]